MHCLSRLLLAIASLLSTYCLVLIVWLGWPATGWILAILGLARCGQRGYGYLTTLASGRFATLNEIKKAGMLSGQTGLILGKISRRFREDQLIRLSNTVHAAVFAPSGAGKGVSLVIPFLLTCPYSCFILDFKGELYEATAEARKRMGHRIVVLDPYKVVTE